MHVPRPTPAITLVGDLPRGVDPIIGDLRKLLKRTVGRVIEAKTITRGLVGISRQVILIYQLVVDPDPLHQPDCRVDQSDEVNTILGLFREPDETALGSQFDNRARLVGIGFGVIELLIQNIDHGSVLTGEVSHDISHQPVQNLVANIWPKGYGSGIDITSSNPALLHFLY